MKKWNKERFATIWENLESMIKLRSLRARIFLLILVIGLVPCIVMRHGIVSNYEDMAVEQRITVVQNQLMILANHLVSNNYLSSHGVREDTGNSREVINAELEMLSNLYEGRVMIINKNFKVEKDTYGISEGKTIISEEVIKCFQGENISHYDPEHGYIEMTTPIMDTTANTTDENGKRNPDAIRGVMLTSISNDSIVNAKEVLNRKAYILEVIMMVAILALAIILSRALTRPFNRVTQAINAVKEGFSDETISVPDYVETVHIVDAFNQLLKTVGQLSRTFGGTLAATLKASAPLITTVAKAAEATANAFSRLPEPVQAAIGLYATFGKAGMTAWNTVKTGLVENTLRMVEYQKALNGLGVTTKTAGASMKDAVSGFIAANPSLKGIADSVRNANGVLGKDRRCWPRARAAPCWARSAGRSEPP